MIHSGLGYFTDQNKSNFNTSKQDSIRIGLLIPDQQTLSAKHGAELAIRRANDKGGYSGKNFKLITRSVEGPWGAGSKESVNLVFEDEVVAILGSLDGRNAHLAEQVATKAHIVFLSTRATDPSLSQAFVPWYFRLFLCGEFGRRAYATTFQTQVGRKITDWVLKRMQTSDADFTNAFVNLDHDVTLRYLQMLSRVDIHQRFKSLDMDIDILYGEHTFTAVRRSVEIFRSLLPQANVKELRGVGHLPMIKGARQLAAFIFGDSGTNGLARESIGS